MQNKKLRKHYWLSWLTLLFNIFFGALPVLYIKHAAEVQRDISETTIVV